MFFTIKLIRLGFIIRQPIDRKSRDGTIKLDKLCEKRRDYIIWKHPFENSISVLKFKDYWMLYDENIEFNNNVYPNTSSLLGVLIQDGTLIEIAMKNKAILESHCKYISRNHLKLTYNIIIQHLSVRAVQSTELRHKFYRICYPQVSNVQLTTHSTFRSCVAS